LSAVRAGIELEAGGVTGPAGATLQAPRRISTAARARLDTSHLLDHYVDSYCARRQYNRESRPAQFTLQVIDEG